MRKIKKAIIVAFAIGVVVVCLGLIVAATYGHSMPVLDTHGLIANEQRNLIYLVTGLGLIIVIPVFIMLFTIAWKYRDTNTKARYQPEFDGSRVLEGFWWGIPIIIIVILAIITGFTTHSLDPYKPIESSAKTVNIQVVALQWRWLFIYPDNNIATLNYVNIPEDTPVHFSITADAPMNSFWIPALAGQIYAMSGMSTQLYVMADEAGDYRGVSANLSGEGFADMDFMVHAMSTSSFADWADNAAFSNDQLSMDSYNNIAEQSTDKTHKTFMLLQPTLYNDIIMKRMPSMHMAGMEME